MRVASYPPNRLGLWDMRGNMGQWCADARDNGVYAVQLILGGSWNSTGDRCRTAYRHGNPATTRSNGVGFRLVRVPDQAR